MTERRKNRGESLTVGAETDDGASNASFSLLSGGKAPSSQKAKRIEARRSLHSPYQGAAAAVKGSPRTPRRTERRTRRRHSTLDDDRLASPTSPQTPSMRALNAIVSFISPFSSAKRSAAFGVPDDEAEEGEETILDDAEGSEVEDEEDEEDVASQLYPSLPSEPTKISETSIVEVDEKDTDDDDDVVQEESQPSDDHVEPEQEEEGAILRPAQAEGMEMEVEIEGDEAEPSEGSSGVQSSNVLGHHPSLLKQDSNPTFGASSTFGQSLSQAQFTPSLLADPAPSMPQAHSPFQSRPPFAAPRFSTPSKMGFGAMGNEPMDASFAQPSQAGPSQGVSGQAPTSSFTFGAAGDPTAVPSLPSFPRRIRPARIHSPLAKNYDLLARFFAEKAEQEARGEGSSSMASMDTNGNDQDGGLTEIEVAGCMRLIEQSYAQGHSAEIERLRHEALARERMNHSSALNLDEEELNFSNVNGGIPRGARGYMSRSPSLPLGAAANEPALGTQLGAMRSRPSNSFLSPHYHAAQSPEDARINRSLAATFQAPLPTSQPKRRHRPLYLGPGVGANATSAILRRTQQGQGRSAALYASRTAQQVREAAPITETNEVTEGSAAKRRRLPGRMDDTPALFVQSDTPSDPTPDPVRAATRPTSFRRQPNDSHIEKANEASPSPRTATAEAMLSILSSGPSIPIRTSPLKAIKPQTHLENGVPANASVVNPYERSTRLSRRTTASSQPSGNSLAAKEKERLKEEREKRQKEMKEREARKESTLEFIQRTAPPSPSVRRGGRRIRLEDDEEDESHDQATAQDVSAREKDEASRRKKAKNSQDAQAKAEEERKHKSEEDRKRKNEELKRRTEMLTSTAKAKAQNATDSAKEPASALASKPFSFSGAFAPKKPSPLSQAASNLAPDSPSGSSEASERDSMKLNASPEKASKKPSVSTHTIIVDDDDDDDDASRVLPTSKPASSLGTKTSLTDASKPTASAPAFSFTSPASTTTPSQVQATTPSLPSMTKPLASTSASASPQEQARNAPVSNLPKFDFALSVVTPQSESAKFSANTAQQAALKTSTADLPKFDFGQGFSTAANVAPSSTKSSFPQASLSQPKPATPSSGFSFVATPTTASEAAGSSSTSQSEPVTAPSASTGDAAVSDKTTSALLSGSGEGEEDEDSMHEVRCKVWNLTEGKWNDLGIGMFRIKKHKGTGKRRVLVRNEGNGKVTVNFNIMSSFKANIDKNVVSFLGFDQAGKPTNYRVKIKTDAGAQEMKGALEESAKAAAAAA